MGRREARWRQELDWCSCACPKLLFNDTVSIAGRLYKIDVEDTRPRADWRSEGVCGGLAAVRMDPKVGC